MSGAFFDLRQCIDPIFRKWHLQSHHAILQVKKQMQKKKKKHRKPKILRSGLRSVDVCGVQKVTV